MRLLLCLMLALLALVCLGNAKAVPRGPVKHFVALMMENRAYDHMLGYLELENGVAHGLKGTEHNLWEPSNPRSKKVFVTPHAKDISPDPAHSVNGCKLQAFGTMNPRKGATASMNGFLLSARHTWGDSVAPRIMECWNTTNLPILSTLARKFALFDDWYASIPGPTYGNRMYFHAGTSDGTCQNDIPAGGFRIKTLYQLLDEAGYDWAFYYEDMHDANFFEYTRRPQFRSRLRPLRHFHLDANTGNLPTMTFIIPRMASTRTVMANDQHPSHSVVWGEALIRTVYEELRQSPSWNASALLVTYDEHGGFYDHVPTPTVGVPNPDNKNCRVPTDFDFTRLGVRVPTILISPWVDQAVVSQPQGPTHSPHSKFEHSSWIATLTRMLDLKPRLTKRTEWAASFDYLFNRHTPRTDAPFYLPTIHKPSFKAYMATRESEPEHLQPPNELMLSYLKAANDKAGLHPEANLEQLQTEEDVSRYASVLHQEWIASIEKGTFDLD